jgi:hypothetical protein
MTTLHKKLLWTTTCMVALSIGTIPAAADVLTITVNTSGLNGSAAEIALDFIGGPSPSNNVTITNFLADGSLGLQTPSGGASGTLPGTVTLDDGSNFFNEELAGITLGNYFSFQVTTTNLGPTTASFPDEFSLFLYDTSFNSLISTSDPTGANAIVTIDLTGGAATSDTIYTSDATFGAPAPAAVPEPASIVLFATNAGIILIVQRRRRGGLRFGGIAARSAAIAAALLGSLSAQTNITTPVAADTSVTVALSGLRLNRTTNTYDSVVTVTDTSAQAISGPFYLAVTGIDVPTVKFSNSAGQLPNQLPYIPLSVGAQLLPNTPVVAGTLKFSDPQNVAFHVNASVWDAASVSQFGETNSALSCAGVVPGSDGTIRLTDTGAGPAIYVPPVDNVGRTAACTPAPGAWLPLGDTIVQCKTSGGAAPPAACSFDYPVTPQIVIYPNGAADLTLTPCNPIVPATPGLPPAGTASNGLIPIVIDYVPACAFAPPGNATFLIVNNGPNVAFNVTVALGVPAGYTNYAMKFDTPARCTRATALVMPNGQPYPGADVIDCFFPAISSGQTITATVGVDLPSANNTSAIPSLYAQVAVDPTQNIDPDLTNNSIFFQPAFPHTFSWPTLPAAASCLHDPDDHTFGVLLDTCGVPSIVVQIVTGIFLGGATLIAGGGALALEEGILTPTSYIFNAAEAGSGIK